MPLIHQHLLVRAWVEEPVETFEAARDWALELVHLLGMRQMAPVTGAYCSVPGNRGPTVLVPIETSHIALHVWDEERPALVELDAFSCREVDPGVVMAHLSSMRPVRAATRFLDRTAGFADMPVG